MTKTSRPCWSMRTPSISRDLPTPLSPPIKTVAPRAVRHLVQEVATHPLLRVGTNERDAGRHTGWQRCTVALDGTIAGQRRCSAASGCTRASEARAP